MKEILVVVGIPHKFLTPNCRPCWQAKSREKKAAREEAYYATLEATGGKKPSWKSATIQATFYHATNRRRDKDNALASLKSHFDGIADAGVVANDAGFTYAPVVLAVDADNPRVEIRITKGAGK